MFYLTIVNKTWHHCHSWLAGQYHTGWTVVNCWLSAIDNNGSQGSFSSNDMLPCWNCFVLFHSKILSIHLTILANLYKKQINFPLNIENAIPSQLEQMTLLFLSWKSFPYRHLYLTYLSLVSFLWDISKQYRTRSDAAECAVWSSYALFAYRIYF